MTAPSGMDAGAPDGGTSDAGSMASGICGDGVVGEGEQCDDANAVSGDGCESDCSFSCELDTDCDDTQLCNGDESCQANRCEEGMPADDGTPCPTGACRAGACAPAGCGNGVVDGEEQCDDGNDVPKDGCENDCTFSCEADAQCEDGDPCNGLGTCQIPPWAR